MGRIFSACVVIHCICRWMCASKEEKEKAPKKPRLMLHEGSHLDAVLVLSRNKVKSEYSESG